MRRTASLVALVVVGATVAAVACGSDDDSGAPGSGGSSGSKGGRGGSGDSSAGASGTSGTGASSGTGATGGSSGSGAAGGTTGSGGASGSSGSAGSGGTLGSAGTAGSGGTAGGSGSAGTGGTAGDAGCQPPSKFMYLNRNGGSYAPGADNARTNTSSVVSSTSVVSSSAIAGWSEIVACVRAKFGAYSVGIVDTDPGQLNHIEIVVTDGTASQIGLPAAIKSVAPLTCTSLPFGVGFVFTAATGTTQTICEEIAFNAGSIYGAEPTTNPCDLMSHVAGCVNDRLFMDAALSCGDTGPAPCRCGGTTQNSSRKLFMALNPACDDDGPD